MFGVKVAVYIMDRLLKPIKEYVHSLGIFCGIYIDDGRTIHKDKNTTWYNFLFILTVMQWAGWNIQWLKTSTVPSQRVYYQGVYTDTTLMRYFTPEYKLATLESEGNKLLKKFECALPVLASDFASFLGKIAAMKKSHGSFVQVVTRRSQHLLGSKVTAADWNVSFLLNFEVASEIKLLLENFRDFNGHHIKTIDAPLKVFHPHEVIYTIENTCENIISKNMSVFVSDASDDGAYCFEANTMLFAKDFTFNEDERVVSSSLRELLAVEKTLTQHKDYFKEKSGEVVYWITDSKCCASFLKKGSRKAHIQDVLLKIKRVEFELKLTIVPIWAPCSDFNLIMADLGSRLCMSTDE